MLTINNDQKINKLASLLNVIADPIRVRIVVNLIRPVSVSCLQQRLSVGQITLLRHLNQMQQNGLLQSEYQGNELYYSLKDIALNNAVKLLLTK